MGRFGRAVNMAGRARLCFGISGKFWVRVGQGRLGVAHLWGGPINISTPPRREMFRMVTLCCHRRRENENEPHARRGWDETKARLHGRGWDDRGPCSMCFGARPCPMPYPQQPASQPATRPATVVPTVWLSCPARIRVLDKAGQTRQTLAIL